MKYDIIYSGIQEYVKASWDIKRLEKVIKKINIEKNPVHVSETYNEAPLVSIELLGEKLDICIDSMGAQE